MGLYTGSSSYDEFVGLEITIVNICLLALWKLSLQVRGAFWTQSQYPYMF